MVELPDLIVVENSPAFQYLPDTHHNRLLLARSDSTCLRENIKPERSEDTSPLVTVVLESTESIQVVEVMLEVNTITEF